jgi:hypothetical protein
MEPFELHPDFYDRPIRLTEEEMADPLAVLRFFFSGTPLSETRQMLWDMVTASLRIRDCLAFETPEQRENLLLLYHDIERALEAAWLISEQTRCKAKTLSPGK